MNVAAVYTGNSYQHAVQDHSAEISSQRFSGSGRTRMGRDQAVHSIQRRGHQGHRGTGLPRQPAVQPVQHDIPRITKNWKPHHIAGNVHGLSSTVAARQAQDAPNKHQRGTGMFHDNSERGTENNDQAQRTDDIAKSGLAGRQHLPERHPHPKADHQQGKERMHFEPGGEQNDGHHAG